MGSDTNVLVRASESTAESRVIGIAEAARVAVEGIWTYEIYGPYGWESRGIHVFENGRVIGGDNRQYSTGRYTISDDTIKAEIITQYYGPPRTVFGEKRERFEVSLVGKLGQGEINGQVVRSDRLQFSLACRLIKRKNLPTPPALASF